MRHNPQLKKLVHTKASKLCVSIGKSHHSLKTGKQTTLIKEATSESSDEVTSTFSTVVDHTKSTVNSPIDFSLKILKIETSPCKRQTSLDGCLVVVKKKNVKPKLSWCVTNQTNEKVNKKIA